MTSLNKPEKDSEEIETISLQNEPEPTIKPRGSACATMMMVTTDHDNDDAETKETSFIETRSHRDSIAEAVTYKERNNLEKDAMLITKQNGQEPSTSPLLDEVAALQNVDRESTRTRDSRRPSTDTSMDTRSITSQSDTRSYRERLKDRINVVKGRAGVSVTSAQKYSKSYPKLSRSAALTRITDMLLKEEADVKEALERHKKLKEFKKQEILSSEKKNSEPMKRSESENDVSYETALEFFTRVWKLSEDLGSTESILNTPQTETENAHALSHDIEDGTKVLAADYLGLKDTLMDPVEFKTPSLISKDALKKKSEEVLFCPSSKPGKKIASALFESVINSTLDEFEVL